MARKDTRLEAQGAEFLVLAHLLIEHVEAHKSYSNYPGYDLVAVNPSLGKTCRIQVKSRFGTNAPGFPINNFDTDYVVFVRLNRGYGRTNFETGRKVPELYVLPVEVVRQHVQPHAYGAALKLKSVPNHEQYLENWEAIKDHLGVVT